MKNKNQLEDEIPEELEFDESTGTHHGTFSNTGNYYYRIIIVNKNLDLYTDMIEACVPVVLANPSAQNFLRCSNGFCWF